MAKEKASGDVKELREDGVLSETPVGDGLVKIVDRDGRVSFLTEDRTAPTDEQHQKAVDLAIEHSPVVNEASPAHSDFDGRAGIEAPEVKEEDMNVVNQDLGVDKNEESK